MLFPIALLLFLTFNLDKSLGQQSNNASPNNQVRTSATGVGPITTPILTSSVITRSVFPVSTRTSFIPQSTGSLFYFVYTSL